jgi:hypothetical protein
LVPALVLVLGRALVLVLGRALRLMVLVLGPVSVLA